MADEKQAKRSKTGKFDRIELVSSDGSVVVLEVSGNGNLSLTANRTISDFGVTGLGVNALDTAAAGGTALNAPVSISGGLTVDADANAVSLPAGSIGEADLAAGAVTAAKVAADAVASENIVNGAVSTGKLAANSVVSGKIEDAAVTVAKLAENSIVTTAITDGNVTGAKLAADSVGNGKIKDGAVTDTKLAADSVGNGKIKDGAVTDTKLAANSVVTAKIKDANVTEGKLAANSVAAGKIKDGAVTNAKLASNSVKTGKIKDDNVTERKLAANSVATGKIKNGAVTDSKLAADTRNKIDGALQKSGGTVTGTIDLKGQIRANPRDNEGGDNGKIWIYSTKWDCWVYLGRRDRSGKGQAYLYTDTSDVSLKQNVVEVSGALHTLEKLRPVRFEWNEAAYRKFTSGIEDGVKSEDWTPEGDAVAWERARQRIRDEHKGTHRGFIAQEVEEVLPEWVSVDEEGDKQINTSELAALLVKATQELNAKLEDKINDLRSEIDVLTNEIETLRRSDCSRLSAAE